MHPPALLTPHPCYVDALAPAGCCRLGRPTATGSEPVRILDATAWDRIANVKRDGRSDVEDRAEGLRSVNADRRACSDGCSSARGCSALRYRSACRARGFTRLPFDRCLETPAHPAVVALCGGCGTREPPCCVLRRTGSTGGPAPRRAAGATLLRSLRVRRRVRRACRVRRSTERACAVSHPRTQPKPLFRWVVRDVVQTRGADLREGCHPHVDANTACLSDSETAAGGRSNTSRRRRDQFLGDCSVVVRCEPPGTPPDPRCRRAVQTCVKGVTPRGEACTRRLAGRSTRTAAEASYRASKIRARPSSRAGSARNAHATRTPGARRAVASRVAFAEQRRA